MNTTASPSTLAEATRIKQVLDANPRDISALLGLAALLGQLKEPDLAGKRKLLNSILAVEPTNQKAREMLLEMDRAEMQAGYSRVTAQPVVPVSMLSEPTPLEGTLVSRYSMVHQALVYPLVGFLALLMLRALGDWVVFFFLGFFFLLSLLPVWFVSAVVHVDGSGLRGSRLFGLSRREMAWSQIDRVEPAPMGVGLSLVDGGGTWMTISSQMSKYPVIVETLRQQRPDLFTLQASELAAGPRTFRKGFFGKYGLLFMASILTVMTLASIPTIVFAIIIGIITFMMWDAALHAVHTLTLEGDRLSARSLRKKHELTAQQIRDIRIATRHNRRGVATTLVQIQLSEKHDFYLRGFPEGTELLYGFLKSWWDNNRSSQAGGSA